MTQNWGPSILLILLPFFYTGKYLSSTEGSGHPGTKKGFNNTYKTIASVGSSAYVSEVSDFWRKNLNCLSGPALPGRANGQHRGM